jgi:hypothetical protein
MKGYRKVTVIVTLSTLVITGVAATRRSGTMHYRNLKVLPKNTTPKILSHIMIDEFEDGLGVGCNFCHATENNSTKLDYASDAKPEKAIARSMMRMTLTINKKFFELKHPSLGDSSIVITCETCHHGQPHPDEPSR